MGNQSCLSIVRFISLPLPHGRDCLDRGRCEEMGKGKGGPSKFHTKSRAFPSATPRICTVHTSAPVLQVGTLGTRFFFFPPPKDCADWVVLRFCSQSTPELGICEVFLAQRCIMYVQYFTPDGCCMYRCYIQIQTNIRVNLKQQFS